MSQLSRLIAKKGTKTLKDGSEEDWQRVGKPLIDAFKRMQKSISFPDMPNLMEHEVKKGAQPFITNNLLNDLINSQTPRKVNYAILIITAISLIVSTLALLKAYG